MGQASTCVGGSQEWPRLGWGSHQCRDLSSLFWGAVLWFERWRKQLLIPKDKGLLSASQWTPATLSLFAQVDECQLLPLRQLVVELVSGVGKAQNGCPEVWEWPVGGIVLSFLGIALHSLLNHQTLSREGRRVRCGHRPTCHASAVTLVLCCTGKLPGSPGF